MRDCPEALQAGVEVGDGGKHALRSSVHFKLQLQHATMGGPWDNPWDNVGLKIILMVHVQYW
jgi:hypothetical protein